MILAEQRALRRRVRKGKTYSGAPFEGHTPKKNPKFKVRGKRRGTSTIKLPEELGVGAKQNADTLFSLVQEIRTAALNGRSKRIVLDHGNVARMSPEAALLILAEIQRCEAYCGGKTTITGTHPRAHEVSELLSEIGFYDALEIKPPRLPDSYKRRTYVRIERKNKTSSEIVDTLLECFSKEYSFDDEDRKRLHVALVECMDNVFEHAYAMESGEPYLYREWWLVGYADHTDSSIGFIFYDQGMGIPATIRKKKKNLIQRSAGLLTWTDGHWIERAVRKPISRHGSRRRGHGLEKLKKFLDGLNVDGTLRVLANHGDVEFKTVE
jgi:anti-sigma regulatory factor (Ser/Thr protein kinase)